MIVVEVTHSHRRRVPCEHCLIFLVLVDPRSGALLSLQRCRHRLPSTHSHLVAWPCQQRSRSAAELTWQEHLEEEKEEAWWVVVYLITVAARMKYYLLAL